MIRKEDADKVLAQIREDEVVSLALDLGNIDSPSMSEGPVAQYVYDWLERGGFEIRRLTYTNAVLFPLVAVARAWQRLRGLRVVHISSTFYGGGVAEMLSSATLLARSLGAR